MSFDCCNCGKNSVNNYGSWCSECQQEEELHFLESQAEWHSRISLCLICQNASGCDSGDKCYVYNMPLYMVGRKKKCKHFKEFTSHDYGECY